MKPYQQYRDDAERRQMKDVVSCPKEATDFLQFLLAERAHILMVMDGVNCGHAYDYLYLEVWFLDLDLNQSFMCDGYTDLIHQKHLN